jgi:hypothetical protein
LDSSRPITMAINAPYNMDLVVGIIPFHGDILENPYVLSKVQAYF